MPGISKEAPIVGANFSLDFYHLKLHEELVPKNNGDVSLARKVLRRIVHQDVISYRQERAGDSVITAEPWKIRDGALYSPSYDATLEDIVVHNPQKLAPKIYDLESAQVLLGAQRLILEKEKPGRQIVMAVGDCGDPNNPNKILFINCWTRREEKPDEVKNESWRLKQPQTPAEFEELLTQLARTPGRVNHALEFEVEGRKAKANLLVIDDEKNFLKEKEEVDLTLARLEQESCRPEPDPVEGRIPLGFNVILTPLSGGRIPSGFCKDNGLPAARQRQNNTIALFCQKQGLFSRRAGSENDSLETSPMIFLRKKQTVPIPRPETVFISDGRDVRQRKQRKTEVELHNDQRLNLSVVPRNEPIVFEQSSLSIPIRQGVIAVAQEKKFSAQEQPKAKLPHSYGIIWQSALRESVVKNLPRLVCRQARQAGEKNLSIPQTVIVQERLTAPQVLNKPKKPDLLPNPCHPERSEGTHRFYRIPTGFFAPLSGAQNDNVAKIYQPEKSLEVKRPPLRENPIFFITSATLPDQEIEQKYPPSKAVPSVSIEPKKRDEKAVQQIIIHYENYDRNTNCHPEPVQQGKYPIVILRSEATKDSCLRRQAGIYKNYLYGFPVRSGMTDYEILRSPSLTWLPQNDREEDKEGLFPECLLKIPGRSFELEQRILQWQIAILHSLRKAVKVKSPPIQRAEAERQFVFAPGIIVFESRQPVETKQKRIDETDRILNFPLRLFRITPPSPLTFYLPFFRYQYGLPAYAR